MKINSVISSKYNIKHTDVITSNYLSTYFSPTAAVNMSNTSITNLNNEHCIFNYTHSLQLSTPKDLNKMPFSIPLNLYDSSFSIFFDLISILSDETQVILKEKFLSNVSNVRISEFHNISIQTLQYRMDSSLNKISKTIS